MRRGKSSTRRGYTGASLWSRSIWIYDGMVSFCLDLRREGTSTTRLASRRRCASPHQRSHALLASRRRCASVFGANIDFSRHPPPTPPQPPPPNSPGARPREPPPTQQHQQFQLPSEEGTTQNVISTLSWKPRLLTLLHVPHSLCSGEAAHHAAPRPPHPQRAP